MEAIGRNSNLAYLSSRWSDLRKRINESPSRPPLSHEAGPKPRSKRFLTADDLADIVTNYEAGATTNTIATRHGISKTRVAAVLRDEGVTIRRQGLNDEQVREAARFYVSGKSLAWLGARFGVSHTTVATALRRQGFQLRRRPGWI